MAYKQLFVRELKERYKQLCAAIHPTPFVGDTLHCVDKVFVDGGIEYLAESWVPLGSYHLLFHESHLKSNRKILIGQPGFGKSTLAIRYANDWCNGVQGSYLKNVEILVLLQLRKLGGVASIYTAIKRSLSTRSQLTDNDIESIIQSSSSVVFILDGFDEYPHTESSPKTDVMKIILSEMFQQFEVILTTRYLPKRYPSETLQYRLTGFDERAQDEYITKAVVENDEIVAGRMKMLLQENPIIQEICQVPLFCTMFVHLSQKNKDLQTFSTLTSFFENTMTYFQMNVRSKVGDKTLHKYCTFDESDVELDKIAFEGLSKDNQQIVWKKQELIERLGEDVYDQYLRIGILAEDEIMEHGDRSSYPCQSEASFCHKIFCEWYAARHLAKCDPKKLNEVLRLVNLLDLQYCFRFACGLNRDMAGKVIEFVKKRGGEKVAILCFLELGSMAEDAVDTVKDLCRGKIQFDEEDSKLLHRSTVQLLEIASSKNISISYVELNKCYSTIDLTCKSHLQLKSNLCLPVLVTLRYLAINGDGKEINAEEFAAILQYSSKCRAMQVLWLTDHVLPHTVQAESVSILRSRRATVMWCPKTGYQRYQLNLQSCQWQHTYKSLSGRNEKRVMTFDDYQRVVAKCRQKRN
ncbi:NACHT, LRR and PYD domains-containing protein 3 [Holothuria leucospilota]|uniref:NACHT, LRR and PYD domains-containing protein 3 n=1 Tax=Holothuria leucospilota TaxID=206669 RepID=A0A9Q1HK54_HOLLE|nr:NACHT, LRR and PYD domains-containing protein 3 [Holothuria leucospilota]